MVLDLMVLEIFSNLNDSTILKQPWVSKVILYSPETLQSFSTATTLKKQ